MIFIKRVVNALRYRPLGHIHLVLFLMSLTYRQNVFEILFKSCEVVISLKYAS